MAAPITFTGLFRWMVVLYLFAMATLAVTTHSIQRDIAAAHEETVILSMNMARFAKYQTELREANEGLVKQRDALSFYTLHLVKENTTLKSDNDALYNWFLELQKRSRQ